MTMTMTKRVSLSRGGPGHRATTVLGLAAALAILSACGGSSKAPEAVVTVPVTLTATASSAQATAGNVQAAATRSDVVGRRFDLGTIIRVEHDGTVPVIIFDRWTSRDVGDSEIAEKGVAIHVHSDASYENLNKRKTFRIPVAQEATFLYRHCVGIDQPPEQRSSTLSEFSRLQEPERIVLLSLDHNGRAVKAQNDPAC